MILHSAVMDNGLKIYVHELPHLQTVTLGLWVEQGAKDETDETNGVSHLIEHLLFNVPTDQGATNPHAYELLSKGARFNATTTKEFTYFYMTVIAAHAPLGFRALASTVRQTVIGPELLERERQIVLHEHRMTMNAATQVSDRFAQSLWGDDLLGRMVIGREDVIRGASRESIQALIDSRYRPDNAGVIVVGGIKHQDAIRLIEEHFSDWEPGAHKPRPRGLRFENNIIMLPSVSDEVSLCLGVNGVGENDPDRYAVELLVRILGGSDQSRLFQEVRQRRALAYAVSAYSNFYLPGGLIAAMVRCHSKDVPEVIRCIADEMALLTTGQVREEEILHAKAASRTELFMQAESSMQLMRLIGRNAMLGKNYSINAHVRAIEAVTSQDIQTVAQRLFDKRNLALALVGNADEDKIVTTLSACGL